MKWKIFLAAIAITATYIVTSCSKLDKEDIETTIKKTPKELKATFSDLGSNQASNERILPPSFDDGAGGSCNCDGHGGTRAFSITWIIATCRSDCDKGLGFRCGREGWLLCRDGTVVICVAGANCPNNRTRTMNADLVFYDDNTVKLVFNNAVPPDESSNNVFEVEQTELIDLPPGMKLDGIHYSGFNVQAGDYTINYSDGQYGSVIVNATLQI